MINLLRKVLPIFSLLIVIFPFHLALSQNAVIFLKSGKSIEGNIIEETTDHITVTNDLGEVKIRRQDIEKIYYSPLNTIHSADSLLKQPLNDHVVVHLKNGEVADGLLIAKSPTMVMLQSEMGRLTVPKQDIKLIEYVSVTFAERGEAVSVELSSGQRFDGYLYHEDRNTLTVNTNIGRLAVDKKELRSISYHASVKFPKPYSKKEEYIATRTTSPIKNFLLHQRQDTFEGGFSSQLGENYSVGGIFSYRNRYNLKSLQTFSLNLEGNLNLAAFSLNKNIIKEANVPGSIEASGAAVVTTLGIGFPIHLYPAESSAYEFFLSPILESHLVNKSLKKTFPSFPSLDSEIRSTDFRFGLGSRVGMEWNFGDKWRAGLSFNIHFLLGENDFNSFNLHIGTRLY